MFEIHAVASVDEQVDNLSTNKKARYYIVLRISFKIRLIVYYTHSSLGTYT